MSVVVRVDDPNRWPAKHLSPARSETREAAQEAGVGDASILVEWLVVCTALELKRGREKGSQPIVYIAEGHRGRCIGV